MPPDSYRYYRLGPDGHLDMAEWFDAASDDDASVQIRVKHPDAKCEIWQGTRLVAQLSPKHFDPDDHELQKAVGQRLSARAKIRREWEPRA